MHESIESFHKYLLPWKTGQVLFVDYVNMRVARHSTLTANLEDQYRKYVADYSEEQHNRVTSILKEVERKELREIYGGSRLLENLVDL